MAEVLPVETREKTTMTIITRFASLADMEQLLGMGKGEGTRLAVAQIDAIFAVISLGVPLEAALAAAGLILHHGREGKHSPGQHGQGRGVDSANVGSDAG